jgi:hypothetical protein
MSSKEVRDLGEGMVSIDVSVHQNYIGSEEGGSLLGIEGEGRELSFQIIRALEIGWKLSANGL